ncbi:sulfurtransferase [Enterovibrio norvegicus]|uniref:Sulfurtransferase n=1 Tax=Enterovibrio norvegicus TaxID=188144 RepID=A0A2N7L8H6_9GAMM|nr:rhodanese-like domain-containing protein [Enterovibrio norvegicus]PMN90503.1 thiosulfate sulfurtransferase [Enterovibrio norvegicus]
MKKSTVAVGVFAALIAGGYVAYTSMFGAEAVQVSNHVLQEKFAEYANPEAFVSAQELKQMMESDEKLVVIGALNPMKPDAPIAGSFSMWRNDYSAAKDVYGYDGMRNSVEDMEALLSKFGATPDSTIVVYAANAHHDAARLFWQIENLGHQNVRYLDGGLNAWMGEGFSTGDANPTVAATSYKAPQPEAETSGLATMEMVLNAQSAKDWVILDTRGQEEFDGKTTVGGAYGPGTIPGSVHINWTKALNEDSTLKSADELAALYGDIIKGKKVIAYCQSGVRSAHTMMVLEEVLGAEGVYNYDGSWIEYSFAHYEQNRADVKVQSGTKS